jgi:hypothetical protein
MAGQEGGTVVDDDEIQTGGMVALVPDNPSAFTVPGGDPAAEMHCTLVYLGDDVTTLDPAIVEALRGRVAALAARIGPVSNAVLGPAIWNQDGGPDGKFKPATVTTLQPGDGDYDADDALCGLQAQVSNAVSAEMGMALFPDQHQPFLPHVTAGYSLPTDVLPTAVGMQTFSTLRLALGGTIYDFPMTGSQEPYGDYASKGRLEMADAPSPGMEVGSAVDGQVALYWPCLAVEGMPTSDDRYIEPDSLTHRALPLSVLAQGVNPGSEGGHAKAEIIGNLTEIWRIPGPEFVSRQSGQSLPDGTYVWQGRGSADASLPGTKLVMQGYLTGNSIDLSELDFAEEIVFAEDGSETRQTTVTKGVIAATTLCAIPAFADAYVEVDGAIIPPSSEALAASVTPTFRAVELGDDCGPCEAELAAMPDAIKAAKKGQAMPPLEKGGPPRYPINNAADLAKAIKAVGRGNGDHAEIRKHIMAVAKKLGLSAKIPDDWEADGTVKAVTASAAEYPPIEAFADPGLPGPTPLTIEGDRVFGHIATWGTCHIGISKRCTPPPRSASDYSLFNVGAKRVRDGDQVRTVAVGHLTMGTGHAELSASADAAARHYDHTGTVVADVAAGEDAHGIWIAGTLVPGLSDTQRDRLLASPPSGDWRSHNGGPLEMVAVLAVNTPGYPVPRSRVASVGGMDPVPTALVAAGALRPASDFVGGIDLDALADRIAGRVVRSLADQAAGVELASAQAALVLEMQQLSLAEDLGVPFSQRPTEVS